MIQLAFIGGSEIVVVLLAALLLFGADKMPEVIRGLSKGMKEFRKVTDDIKKEFEESTRDIKEEMDDVTSEVKKNAEEASSNLRNYIDDSDIAKDLKDIDKDLKG
jgi:TatA/E family protein of Tat protein translocase